MLICSVLFLYTRSLMRYDNKKKSGGMCKMCLDDFKWKREKRYSVIKLPERC